MAISGAGVLQPNAGSYLPNRIRAEGEIAPGGATIEAEMAVVAGAGGMAIVDGIANEAAVLDQRLARRDVDLARTVGATAWNPACSQNDGGRRD